MIMKQIQRINVMFQVLSALKPNETITTADLAGEMWWRFPVPPSRSSLITWLNRNAAGDPEFAMFLAARVGRGSTSRWRRPVIVDTTPQCACCGQLVLQASALQASRALFEARQENSGVPAKIESKPRSADRMRRARLERGRRAASQRERWPSPV